MRISDGETIKGGTLKCINVRVSKNMKTVKGKTMEGKTVKCETVKCENVDSEPVNKFIKINKVASSSNMSEVAEALEIHIEKEILNKKINFIYSELFVSTSLQKYQNKNNICNLIPKHHYNIQEAQVQLCLQKKIDYDHLIDHFKKALNYSLEDNDQNNLDELILFYITKKKAMRNIQIQQIYTNENQASVNIKLSDEYIYDVNSIKDPVVRRGKNRPLSKRLKAFNENK
ncbi:10609_t:CDS:2, partial [Racocetra fulgida]